VAGGSETPAVSSVSRPVRVKPAAARKLLQRRRAGQADRGVSTRSNSYPSPRCAICGQSGAGSFVFRFRNRGPLVHLECRDREEMEAGKTAPISDKREKV
jgi:hypothetical protein